MDISDLTLGSRTRRDVFIRAPRSRRLAPWLALLLTIFSCVALPANSFARRSSGGYSLPSAPSRTPSFGGGFGGGGAASTRRYSLTFSVNARNVLNKVNAATPVGVLSSPNFGQSIALAGGPFSSAAANRKIELQAMFSF